MTRRWLEKGVFFKKRAKRKKYSARVKLNVVAPRMKLCSARSRRSA